MKPLRIYIAGPITLGDTLAHVGDGITACNRLLDEGLAPFCPHLSAFLQMVCPRDHAEWLAYDLCWLPHCHALLRLPGPSRGANEEVAEALRLGMPVFGNVETLLGWARHQSGLAEAELDDAMAHMRGRSPRPTTAQERPGGDTDGGGAEAQRSTDDHAAGPPLQETDR